MHAGNGGVDGLFSVSLCIIAYTRSKLQVIALIANAVYTIALDTLCNGNVSAIDIRSNANVTSDLIGAISETRRMKILASTFVLVAASLMDGDTAGTITKR